MSAVGPGIPKLIDPGDAIHLLGDLDRLWLFLDYDGTLAEFAPTPDHIIPDPELISLLERLAALPDLRLSVISGRRLSHIRQLVPVSGLLLGGTYGLELLDLHGEQIDRLAYDAIRPTLDAILPRWQALLDPRDGFYLEDKGWSLAIHARYAPPAEAQTVLAEAEQILDKVQPDTDVFQVLGGEHFFEIGPRLGNKGLAVEHLLEAYPFSGSGLLYIGDDDKDEQAFVVIRQHAGKAIVVSEEARLSQADFRLENPAQVRLWLNTLLRQWRTR